MFCFGMLKDTQCQEPNKNKYTCILFFIYSFLVLFFKLWCIIFVHPLQSYTSGRWLNCLIISHATIMKEEGDVYHSHCSIKTLSQHIPEVNEKHCILPDTRIRLLSSTGQMIHYWANFTINGAVTKQFYFYPLNHYQNKYKICVQY